MLFGFVRLTGLVRIRWDHLSRLFSLIEVLSLLVHTSAVALVRSGTSLSGLQFSFCTQPVLFK